MSASLRSAAPAGAPRPVPDFGRSTPPLQRSAAHDRRAGLPLDGISRHAEQEAPAEGPQEPSSRPGTPESGLAVRDRCYRADSGGPGEHSGRTVPALEAEQSSGDLLSRRRPRPGFRLGRRRGVAGLVVVCVLALGVAACSVNEDSAEGAAASVGYFLDLYRYAFMTGNTTELAKMSEDGCKFCQSAISRATSLHAAGGWIDKWEQDVINLTYYEKLEGHDYNRVTVVVDYGPMTSHPGDGGAAKTSDPDEGRNLNFGVRYVNGRWSVGGVEVVK